MIIYLILAAMQNREMIAAFQKCVTFEIEFTRTSVLYFQAMVAKYSSISTRKLPKALTVLTRDKTMVATSDYNDFHKLVKRLVMAGMLGSAAQV